jgi:hypothetical protein
LCRWSLGSRPPLVGSVPLGLRPVLGVPYLFLRSRAWSQHMQIIDPGDNTPAHYTTLEGPQGSATGFLNQMFRSLLLTRGSLSRHRGLLARPPINQSNLLFRQQRRRVASPAGQRSFAFRCGAERNPVSFIDRSCCAILARAAHGSAVFWPGLQSTIQISSFDSGGVAWRRLQVGVVLRVLRCPYTVWRWARPCQLHRQCLLSDHRSSSRWRGQLARLPQRQPSFLWRQQRRGPSRARRRSTLQFIRFPLWR